MGCRSLLQLRKDTGYRLDRWMVFFAAVCAFFSVFTGTAQAHELERITIQLKWNHSFQFAGYYAAIEKGYYAEAGLDVHLRERQIGESVIDKVMDGEAEYGITDSGLLLSRLKGRPVVLVAQVFQHSPLVLITMGQSGIATPYNLEGKRIMLASADHDELSIRMMLRESIGSIAYTPVPHTQTVDDLIEGRVDAMAGYLSDQPFQLKARGHSVYVIHPRDYGLLDYGDNLFTTQAELQKHPKRVAAVRAATLRGWEYAFEHSDEIIDLIRRNYAPKSPRELLAYEARMTHTLVLPEVIPLGVVNVGRLEQIAKMFVKMGVLDTAEIPGDFVYVPPVSKVGPPKTEHSNFNLSAAEKDWLKNHRMIRVGSDPTWEPVEFVDSSGRVVGISRDYLDILERLLDVHFLTPAYASWQEVYEKTQAGEIDVLSAAASTPERLEYLTFSDPFLKLPNVVFSRDNLSYVGELSELVGLRVGVVKDYAVYEKLRTQYPELTLVPAASVDEVLYDLAMGKTDACIETLMTGDQVIKQRGYTNVRVVGDTPFTHEFSIAVRKDWQPLVGILNKALASITISDREAIRTRWMPLQTQTNPNWELALRWGLIIGGMMFLLLIVVLLWNHQMRDLVMRRTTELSESNAALREREERLRALFNKAGDLVMVIDLEGTIVQANESACKSLGYQEEELLGMHITEIDCDVSTREKLQEVTDQVTREQKVEIEVRYRRKDGSEFPVELHIARLDSPLGTRYIGAARDISARAQAEKDQELLRQQLNQSQKMEAIGQLAGGVAHDFNNLLTSIYGRVDMLQDQIGGNQEAQESLRCVRETAEQAAGVTRALLTFSHRLESRKQVVDVQLAVDKSVRLLRRLIPTMIEVKTECVPLNQLFAKLDETQFQQVIINLALNARDAMPGGGELTIAVRYLNSEDAPTSLMEEHPHGIVAVEVSDSGTGLTPEVRERMFEPFFTTKSRGSGTGLGLAIVHGVVKEHGGAVHVDSTLGEGASFTVVLSAAEPQNTDLLADSPAEVTVSAVAHGQTVLVADDDQHVRQVVEMYLQSAGYKVLVASDGIGLVQVASSQRDIIDIMVVDYEMPKITGVDALAQLRERGIKTIAFLATAHVGTDLNQSIDAYTRLLHKPFEMAELGELIAAELAAQPKLAIKD